MSNADIPRTTSPIKVSLAGFFCPGSLSRYKRSRRDTFSFSGTSGTKKVPHGTGPIFQGPIKNQYFLAAGNNTCKWKHCNILHLILHLCYLSRMAYVCSKCTKSFTQMRNFTRHMKTTHLGKAFKCQECDKSFTRMDALIRHDRNISSWSPTHAISA